MFRIEDANFENSIQVWFIKYIKGISQPACCRPFVAPAMAGPNV